jgi:hypothetical protein
MRWIKKSYYTFSQGNLGVKKVSAPSKNPSNCPIMSFARQKKIISRTFQISSTLIVILSQGLRLIGDGCSIL